MELCYARRSETTFLHVEKNMQGLCEDAYLRYNLITRAHIAQLVTCQILNNLEAEANDDQTVGSEVGLCFYGTRPGKFIRVVTEHFFE